MRRAVLVTMLAVALAGVAHAEDAQTGTVAAPTRAIGQPHARPLTGAALDARTEEVAALLRCPVCQGLSVADSPAGMAQKMKREVRDLLAEGYDEEQILAYFERSYGEFVRLDPPLRGVNWLVWLGPLFGLIAGIGIVAWALRRPRATAAAVPAESSAGAVAQDPPGRDALPEDPRLAAYVLKVREAAYGWSGGVSPGKGPGC